MREQRGQKELRVPLGPPEVRETSRSFVVQQPETEEAKEAISVEGTLTVSEDTGAAGENSVEQKNSREQWVLEPHGRWVKRRRLWEGLSSEARSWFSDTVQQEG